MSVGECVCVSARERCVCVVLVGFKWAMVCEERVCMRVVYERVW